MGANLEVEEGGGGRVEAGERRRESGGGGDAGLKPWPGKEGVRKEKARTGFKPRKGDR